MRQPLWLGEAVVRAMYRELIAEHGGLDGGVRDEVLAGALARPMQRWHYERGLDIFALAACLMNALARAHPFSDGNKRVALMAGYVFLRINGWELDAPEVEAVFVTRDVAEGLVDEPMLAAWLKRHARKAKRA